MRLAAVNIRSAATRWSNARMPVLSRRVVAIMPLLKPVGLIWRGCRRLTRSQWCEFAMPCFFFFGLLFSAPVSSAAVYDFDIPSFNSRNCGVLYAAAGGARRGGFGIACFTPDLSSVDALGRVFASQAIDGVSFSVSPLDAARIRIDFDDCLAPKFYWHHPNVSGFVDWLPAQIVTAPAVGIECGDDLGSYYRSFSWGISIWLPIFLLVMAFSVLRRMISNRGRGF